MSFPAAWIAFTLAAPAAQVAPPEAQTVPPPPPLAELLLQPTLSWDLAGRRVSVWRGTGRYGPRLVNDSLTADGLDLALVDVPEAAGLARRAHRELQWGYSLSYSGILGVLAGAVCVSVGAAQITDSTAQNTLSTVGGTLLVA